MFGEKRMRRGNQVASTGEFAWKALAGIMFVNGCLGIFAPRVLIRGLGVKPELQPGMMYVFRMFGIRTVLIGAELLVQTGERRAEATRRAVLIHASDTVAAFLATTSGKFPKNGRIIVVISAVNTVLAIIANRG